MTVYPILSLDLKLTDEAWDFAVREKPRIESHWAAMCAKTPALWNGEVLMCLRAKFDGSMLRAQFIRADFASLVAWRDWGWPSTQALNCFGSAAVLSCDGVLLYGRMASHTVNAGRVYPPGGSLEPADVTSDGCVDVLSSIARELTEETGLDVREAVDDGLVAVFDDRRLAIAQILRFPQSGANLEQRISDHIATEANPELSGVVALHHPVKADSAMPGFALELARHLLSVRAG